MYICAFAMAWMSPCLTLIMASVMKCFYNHNALDILLTATNLQSAILVWGSVAWCRVISDGSRSRRVARDDALLGWVVRGVVRSGVICSLLRGCVRCLRVVYSGTEQCTVVTDDVVVMRGCNLCSTSPSCMQAMLSCSKWCAMAWG